MRLHKLFILLFIEKTYIRKLREKLITVHLNRKLTFIAKIKLVVIIGRKIGNL